MSNEARKLRLLAVNPNLTTGVTDAFVREAQAIAPEHVVIDGLTGEFGATIVSTEAENIIASYAALDLLAKHASSYDAVILAISFDSGLDGAREIMPIPVVGITEATLLAAADISNTIGLVSFGAVSLPLYQRLAYRYGLSDKVAGWEVVEIANASGYLDPKAQDDAVLQAIERMQTLSGITAAVILGTAVVGMAGRLQSQLPIPIFDGAAPSVAAALAAIDAGVQPRSSRPLSHCIGISPDLAALIASSS